MKPHAFRLMIPFLRQHVNLVRFREPPRDFHSVTFRAAGRNKSADKKRNFHDFMNSNSAATT